MTVVSLPRSRPLTYADLEDMPDDGHRYELLDGVLLVSPGPRPRHQEAVVPPPRAPVRCDSTRSGDVRRAARRGTRKRHSTPAGPPRCSPGRPHRAQSPSGAAAGRRDAVTEHAAVRPVHQT